MKRQKDRTLKDELPRSVGGQYAIGEQWRNNFRKNEGMEPKQKTAPSCGMTGDRSKVWCCKEQYCIGNWNVRSINLNYGSGQTGDGIDILGIRELKWTGMGEFNSDYHYIYYCGQETPGITGKFGLRMQNEAGQRLIEFCQENALVIANTGWCDH